MYRKTFSLKIIFLTFAFVISFGICFTSEENNTVQTENKNNQELLEVINECVNEIKTVENKINELSQLGYKVYLRDSNSDIYKLDNITEYFSKM